MPLAVALLALSGCGGAQPREVRSPASPADYADRLVDAANRARADHGQPLLERSACADAVARWRARALVGGPLHHRPLVGFVRECAPGARAAENLVNSGATPAEVVEAWLASPGHRNNLVDPGLAQVGVGCVPSEKGLLCSQLFLGE